MKRERVFSKGGFYGFCVTSNALMHREASLYGSNVLARLLPNFNSDSVINVLDLACGGMPVTLTSILEQFPDKRFSYTGIDINPDQIDQLKNDFEFPDNIVEINALTDNAWDLPISRLKAPYDVIFKGFSMHHGTPEEIYHLAKQLYSVLSDQGVFINIDFYRPDEALYVRRPQVNPENPQESFALINESLLDSNDELNVVIKEAEFDEFPSWKSDFLNITKQVMLERGGDPVGVKSMIDHARQRDYPVSPSEVTAIFNQAGFKVDIIRYENTGEPMEKYFVMPVATK